MKDELLGSPSRKWGWRWTKVRWNSQHKRHWRSHQNYQPPRGNLKESKQEHYKHSGKVGTKESEEFFETVGLSGSTIYFKMNFQKFFSKYPVMTSPMLSTNCFKNNFKKLPRECRFIWQERLMILCIIISHWFVSCCKNLVLLRDFSPFVRIFLVKITFSCCKNYLVSWEISPVATIFSCFEKVVLL